MKLNYRDKIILSIVLAVAILLAGYFALIKPKTEEISSNKQTLETLESQKRDIEAKIAQIKPLQDSIKETHKNTTALTKDFVDLNLIKGPVKLDVFMQKFAEDSELRVTEAAYGNTTESPIPYYYIENTDVGSALRQSADINGDLQAKVDKENAEGNQLSQRFVETIMKTQYSLKCTGKLENIYKYMELIEKFNDAVIIESYSLNEHTEENEENKASGEGEEGSTPKPSQSDVKDEDKLWDAEFVVSLYSVYEMSEPNVEAE